MAQPFEPVLVQFPYYTRLFRYRWGRDANAAGGHLARAVHAQLVEQARARPQIRGQALGQPRNVEEYVPPPVIRPQKAEALGLEVSYYRTGLLAAGQFPARFAGLAGGT